jgi:hypothetical protein
LGENDKKRAITDRPYSNQDRSFFGYYDQPYNKLMDKNLAFRFFCYLAIIGNILIVLWILYNVIDEGFQGTIYQIASAIGLILLLTLETVLLSLAEIRSKT